jgi:hypothetical protein
MCAGPVDVTVVDSAEPKLGKVKHMSKMVVRRIVFGFAIHYFHVSKKLGNTQYKVY